VSKPACVKGDITTGHGAFPPRKTSQGSGNVFINGKSAYRSGDSLDVHCIGKTCHKLSAHSGSSTVLINAKDAMRVGDLIECGEFMAIGSSTVLIGD